MGSFLSKVHARHATRIFWHAWYFNWLSMIPANIFLIVSVKFLINTTHCMHVLFGDVFDERAGGVFHAPIAGVRPGIRLGISHCNSTNTR